MESHNVGIQRSFRLKKRTLELLDEAAYERGESRNATADRLLGEALRLERHPLIRFAQGASGRRQPMIVGTRFYVHQLVSSFMPGKDTIAGVATAFDLTAIQVRAALDYYAEFKDEIDADVEYNRRADDREHARWLARHQTSG